MKLERKPIATQNKTCWAVHKVRKFDEPDIAGISSKTIVFGTHDRGNDAKFTSYSFWHDEQTVQAYMFLGDFTQEDRSNNISHCTASVLRSQQSNQRYDQDRESTIRSFLACDVIVWKYPVTVHAFPICRNPVMLGDKSVFLTSFACANHSAVAAKVVSTTPYSDWSIVSASGFPRSLIYRISQGKQ
ncbi:unnamed protein product [Albugo candida]|uniref:Uncharacterized protein n=1 Tax=Albugo candida TaxID=65357 RepID=A0A024GVN9_9STRA|nr:unnamed protein product [Albugo candida]|eukprot:CCI50739.1 unnamed protein product [Albugo candida]